MKIADKIVKNIIGTPRKRGGKSDWDGDGVINSKDCQPRNTMRQDARYKVKQVGDKYMIYDTGVGSFLIGYSFDTNEEASDFIGRLG